MAVCSDVCEDGAVPLATSRHLLFVGQAVQDHVFHIDHLTAEAGKFEARAYRCNAAGLAANAAVAAQRLRDSEAGLTVRLVSAVGNDTPGDALRLALQVAGLDIDSVARVDGARWRACRRGWARLRCGS